MELVNEIYKLDPEEQKGPAAAAAIENVVLLLAPFVPHLCEEMGQMLGRPESVFSSRWPTYDEAYLQKDEIEYVIQVNGKVRSKIVVSAAAGEEEVKKAALADARTQEWIRAGTVKKVLVVARKLVSIVVA
jgi:leucyl-tRNA synthetase